MNDHPHDTLVEKLENVWDPNSFLEFVDQLIRDRQTSVEAERLAPSSPFAAELGGWENTSIESFLSAAHAWATATDFGSKDKPEPHNDWKKFALFLYLGKIYE